MKLYLVSQDINNGWDTYDSMVVAAESENDARAIHPSNYTTHVTDGAWMGTYSAIAKEQGEYLSGGNVDWVKYSQIDQLTVKFLGETKEERGVILSSFNAG